MTRRLNEVGCILVLAAVYFGAAKFGLSLAFANASATAVWPPTGIALAVLLSFVLSPLVRLLERWKDFVVPQIDRFENAGPRGSRDG